jgi:hypothetical protein
MDEVVTKVDDGGRRGYTVAGGGKANPVIKLVEELVDGSGWVPRGGHAKSIDIEFHLSDGAPSGPEVSEDVEASDTAEA